jgi:S-adenosylmethionine:tRNA ribosyltransferase-isomerase
MIEYYFLRDLLFGISLIVWYDPAMIQSVVEPLRLSDFDYELPVPLIAQEPCAVRDQSRLLSLNRNTGSIEHLLFSDVERFIRPGDLLVLNDTKVFPCRLSAKKTTGGKTEIFLVSEREQNLWEALIKGGVEVGKKLELEAGLVAEVEAEGPEDTRIVRFLSNSNIKELLPVIGKVPLPPYIKREPAESDRARYQTTYALHEGAVAAPTAGLHFTYELLRRLAAKGVVSAMITLHVGPGTFQPVRADRIAEHRMLSERYVISREAAVSITRARKEGRRIIAVGTTSVRALETAAEKTGVVVPGEGSSDLYIYPGYRFRVIDGIITNFHLPKSTLLMLVSAFAGRERILSAYREAVKQKYRFYSYGDAMLIM